nr:MAG TPA: protease [Caudoviricetes sp.]
MDLHFSFSPAVSRSLTGCYVNSIGKRPKKRQFLRRGVEKIS